MTATPTPEAVATLEQQLGDPACRVEAARALVPIYQDAGDSQKLLAALEALAIGSADLVERAQVLQQAAQVYLSNLKQPDLALATAARALSFALVQPELLQTARQAAEQADQLDIYADLLDEVVEKAPRSACAPLHRELAEQRERLGDRDAAMLHLRAAAEADPLHADTLKALLRAYRGQEQWAALAETLEKASRALPDRPAQLEALREAASVHEARLDDKESALSCWKEIVAREPTDREAAVAVERLATDLDRPAELIAALQAQRMSEGPGPRDRDLAVRLAQIKLERLGEARTALDMCGLVLEQDPAHAGARRVAEACALRPGSDGAGALAMLDRHLARLGEHDARVGLRERRLATAADEEKLALFGEACDLCRRHLHQPERAFLAGLKVFAAGVERAKLQPELERLAEETDSLEELAEVFEATAEGLMPGEALNAQLCRSAARIREKLGEPEAATGLWNDLLCELPGDREALEHLATLYEATNDARRLAEVCARKALLATDTAERVALFEKAGAAREAAGENEEAIAAFRAALEIDKGASAALAGLDRLYGRGRRLAEQAEVLAQLIAITREPTERRMLQLRAGKLWEKEGRGSAALRVWTEMLAGAASDDDAIAGLERLLERDDVCQEAGKLLEDIYRKSDNARGLAEVLELRVEATALAADRVALLREVASLHERLGDREAAVGARARAFRERPQDPALRGELERAAQAGGCLDALVGVYEDVLEGGVGEPLAGELWRQVATIYSEKLERPELAARAWSELSRRSPDDVALLRRLVDTYRRTRGFRQLVEALSQLAAIEPAADEKVELLFEAAQVAEEALADKELAIACYRKVLELQPADRNAVKLLQRLLGETGQHEALASLLEKDIELAGGNQEEVAQLQVSLASLRARHLKNPRGALRLLVQVLTTSPFHRGASELVEELAAKDGPVREEAATLLETMLEGGGDAERVVAALEAKLASKPSHSERVVILRRLAVLRAKRQDNPELGFLSAANALREAPGDAASLQLCVDLACEAGAEEELASLLEEIAPLAISAAARIALFRALARLQLAAGDDAAAEKSLREVLESAPGDPEASEALETVYERLARPRDHVALLRRRLSAARETAEKSGIVQKIADVWLRAGEDASAAEALREAHAIEPDPKLLGTLEPVLGRLGRFDEQAQVLEELLSASPPSSAHELLNRRAASLAAAGHAELAVTTWGQVLERWPADRDAIAGLKRLLADAEGKPALLDAAKLLEAAYRASGDSRRYVEMLELRLEGAQASERARLLSEVASVREDLGDTMLAFSARRRLFAESPEDAAARTALERLAADGDLLGDLLAVYEDQVERGASPALATALWRRIAQLRFEQMSDREGAAAAWEEVARREPGNPEPLAALATLYGTKSAQLADVLARQAKAEPDPDAKAARLFEAARIAEHEAHDPAGAARCYQQILEILPEDRRALDALHGILSAGQQHGALAQVLEREIALATARGETEAALAQRLDLARIRLDYLNDAAGALALFAEILRARPGFPAAIEELEQLALSDDPARADAATILEPALEAASDWTRLLAVLEAHAAASPPSARAKLLARAAEVCSTRLQDHPRAFLLAARALREAPADPALLAGCKELAAAAGMHEELCALLEELADAVGPEERGRLLRLLSAEQEHAGEDAKTRAAILDQLTRLEADPREQQARLLELAKLAEEKLSDAPLATRCYREVLARAPDNALAADRLGPLLLKSASYDELDRLLMGRIDAARQRGATDETIRFQLELAQLQVGPLAAPLAALGLVREVLQERPAHPQAIAVLKEIVRSASPVRVEAAALLEPLAAAQGDHESLVEALEIRAAVEPSVYGRADVLRRIAELQGGPLKNPRLAFAAAARMLRELPDDLAILEQCVALAEAAHTRAELIALIEEVAPRAERPPARAALYRALAQLRENEAGAAPAFDALASAFREDPDDPSLDQRLEAAAEAGKSWNALAGLLEQALTRLGSKDRSAAVSLWLGRLCEEKLDAAERAVAHFERARAASEAVALPALARLFEKLGRYQELAGALEVLIDRTDRDEVRSQLLARLGAIAQEKLNAPQKAAACYQRILKLDAHNVDAARSLEGIHRAQGDHHQLLAILKRQSGLVTGTEREAVRMRMAEVCATSLGDIEQAVTLYRAVLADNWRCPEALERLEALLTAQGRHGELRALLEDRIGRTLDLHETAQLRARLANLFWHTLGQTEDAIVHFSAALECEPKHEPSLAALRAIYEKLSRKAELVDVLRRLATVLEGPAAKATWLQLAELLERPAERAEALEVAGRALAQAPHADEELARLRRIFTAHQAWPEAAKVLDLGASAKLASGDSAGALEDLFAQAEIWVRAHEPMRAAPLYERVLEIDPRNRKAYEALSHLYTQGSQWASWAQLVSAFLPRLADDAERLEALVALAGVQETRLNEVRPAFDSVCRALRLSPADDALLDRAWALAETLGANAEFAAVCREILAALGASPAATKLGLRLAELLDLKLADPQGAAEALQRLLAFNPQEVRALDALAAITSRRGLHAEHVAALEDKVEAIADPKAKKALLAEIAKTREEQLRDPVSAAAALRRSVEIAGDSETWRALADLHRRHAQWADAVRALVGLRDLAATAEKRAEVQLEVAGIRERELHDEEAAIEDYRVALELDSRCQVALEALERLYTRHDRPLELVKILEHQLGLAGAAAERVRLLFACAALHEERLKDLARADECLESVLTFEPRNLVAIRGLERLRRAQHRFKDLALIMEGHLPLCSKRGEQVSLSLQLAELYRDQLKDTDRAVSCYQRALGLDAKCRAAAHALTDLFEKGADWPRMAEMLQREAELAEGADAAGLCERAGQLLLQKLGDLPGARAAHQKALAIDPGHLPSLRALQDLFKREGDWDQYEQVMLAEAEHTVEPDAKRRITLDVARHFAARRDSARARKWFEAALKLAPDSIDAAAPLADLASARGDWSAAERMLDIVTRQLSGQLSKGEAGAAPELCRQLYRLGQVCREGGHSDKALHALEEASALEPGRVEVLEDLGDLLTEAGRLEDALEVFQRLLTSQAAQLAKPALAAQHCRLAALREKLGEPAAACSEIEKALGADPANEPALRARVRLAEAAGEWKESVELRARLVDVLKGPARFEASVELGDVARDKLKSLPIASAAYVQALASRPNELPVMEKLVGVYRELRQWSQADKLLQAMLAHPRVPKEQRQQLYLALGEVAGSELVDVERAVAAYDAALDLDAGFVPAFSALEGLLRKHERHKRLEEAYVRQLKRLPATDQTRLARAALWRTLGDLRARDLRDEDAALAAYLASTELAPDDAPAQEALAVFAARIKGHEKISRAAWRRALPTTDDPGRVCLALGELAIKQKDLDSAFLAMQVFDGLVEQGGAKEKLAQLLSPPAPRRPRAVLTEGLWQKTLFDPWVRGPIGELLGLLVEQAGSVLAEPHSKYGIAPKKHRLDLSAAQPTSSKLAELKGVSRLFALPSAEIFSAFLGGPTEANLFRGGRPAPDRDLNIELCATHPMSLKLGGRFFSSAWKLPEKACVIGYWMAFLRPELAMARLVPRERIGVLLQAAISLVNESYRSTADAKALAKERKLLKRALNEPALVALSTVVRHYLPSARPDDVPNWLDGAELTAARAALLVAGEVSVFKRVVLDSGMLAVTNERVARRRLIDFVMGGDLHTLRAALGSALPSPSR